MIISLTGFMGCGKSCIGRELNSLTGWSLIDLDQWIENQQGRSIRQIFSEHGEAVFRKIEAEALSQVISEHTGETHTILSLGGGALTTPESASLIHWKTLCIYLKAGMETLVYNLSNWPGDRPILGDHPDENALRKRITELMNQRSSVYEQTSHIVIDIDGKSYSSIAEDIAGVVAKLNRRS